MIHYLSFYSFFPENKAANKTLPLHISLIPQPPISATMAKVHILNVTVHNNPAPFITPFQFEIHFECLEELQDGTV